MSESAILAELRSIKDILKPKSPYFDNETLSKASAVTAFGTTLEIAGQEFDQFVIQSDGNEDDISYRVKNLQGGFTQEIEVSKFPYIPGPVDLIQFKNDVAESGKSIFVRKIRLGKLVSPPIVLEIDKLFPSFRSGAFKTGVFQNEQQLAENTGNTVVVTYTVGTGKRAKVDVAGLDLLVEIASTSTTVTDSVSSQIRITPEGGSAGSVLTISLNSPIFAAGDHVEGGHTAGFLDEGDVYEALLVYDGDAAGAGRVRAFSGMKHTEWDAS